MFLVLLVRAFPSACSGWGPCCCPGQRRPRHAPVCQGFTFSLVQVGSSPAAEAPSSLAWEAAVGSPGRRSVKQVVTKKVVIPESANGSGRSLARTCSVQLAEANRYHQSGGWWEEAASRGRCSRLGETPATSAALLGQVLT